MYTTHTLCGQTLPNELETGHEHVPLNGLLYRNAGEKREQDKNRTKTLIYCLSLHRWNSLETHNSMSKLCAFSIFWKLFLYFPNENTTTAMTWRLHCIGKIQSDCITRNHTTNVNISSVQMCSLGLTTEEKKMIQIGSEKKKADWSLLWEIVVSAKSLIEILN